MSKSVRVWIGGLVAAGCTVAAAVTFAQAELRPSEPFFSEAARSHGLGSQSIFSRPAQEPRLSPLAQPRPLAETPRLSPEADEVQRAYDMVESIPAGGGVAGASDELMQSIYLSAANNPVAALSSLPRYDPPDDPTGAIGYCFGRSMTVQLYSRIAELPGDMVRKLFVVGDLKQRGAAQTEWRFHVTTIVKKTDGNWWAIDPIFERPMLATEWITRTTNLWDRWRPNDERGAKYYIVNRHAVLPDIRAFQPPERETGTLLIDLSFDPTGRPGFTRTRSYPGAVYTLEDSATVGYFQTATEDPHSERFDYLGLTFNDGFSKFYHGYFVELMRTFPEAAADPQR